MHTEPLYMIQLLSLLVTMLTLLDELEPLLLVFPFPLLLPPPLITITPPEPPFKGMATQRPLVRVKLVAQAIQTPLARS